MYNKDLLGREVAELAAEDMPAGEYKINFQAKGLASWRLSLSQNPVRVCNGN